MVGSIFEGVPTISSVLLPHSEETIRNIIVILILVLFGLHLKRYINNLKLYDIIKEKIKMLFS